MGGSTADAFDSANKYTSAKLGRLQEHTERQTNELAKTAEKNLEGSIDNTLGAAGRETTKGLQAMGLMAGGNDSGGGSDGSASANYSNKSTASSKGSGKKADLSKDKSKKTGGKASLYAKKK
jgi:hypothetical protein